MVELFAIDIGTVTQLVLQHLRVTNNGVEWRPQFMTHVGEEHTFGGVRRVGVGPRSIHFFDRNLQLGRHFVEGAGEIADFTRVALLVDPIREVTGSKPFHTSLHPRQ